MPIYAESTLKMPLGQLKNITAKDINTNSNSISALNNLHFSLSTSDLLKRIEEKELEEKKKEKNQTEKTPKFFCYIILHIPTV